MSLRLTIQRRPFETHLRSVAESLSPSDGHGPSALLVPVVKGNGYGLGRPFLISTAADLFGTSRKVAVGTIYEAHDVPLGTPVQVLSPLGEIDTIDIPANAIPTVGNLRDLQIVTRRSASQSTPVTSVVVKLASAMRRFGTSPEKFADLVQAIGSEGFIVDSCALHVPLQAQRNSSLVSLNEELAAWLSLIPKCVTVSLSHVTPSEALDLARHYADNTFEVRMGTMLWHGDKSFFALHAEVLETHSCVAGDTAGYHGTSVPGNGTLAVIGAGTTHGVTPVANGDSPFHFQRKRLHLLEFPYMHNAIVFVPQGTPTPQVGELLDVQRPLTSVSPDFINFV